MTLWPWWRFAISECFEVFVVIIVVVQSVELSQCNLIGKNAEEIYSAIPITHF